MLLTARYVLPISSPHIENGAVLVRDGSIVEAGERAQLTAAHPGEEVRDYGLAVLLPGFVDLHTHLEFAVMRGLVNDLPYSGWKLSLLDKEQLLEPADWDQSARLGALEALQSGITTIADITETGASARAVAESGLRAVVYCEVSTMKKSLIPEVLAGAEEMMAAWGEEAGPLAAIGIAPHAPYSCHPELYRRTAALAAERGLRVSTHLAGSRDEYDFVKYGSSRLAVDYSDRFDRPDVAWFPTGVSPVKYLLQWGFFDVPGILAVHCVQVDDADIEVLAGRDVRVAHCPRCNAKLAMGIAPLRRMLDRGLIVGIGTDSPASNNTMDVFDEMRIGLLLQRATRPHDSFFEAERFVRMATIEGAKALGIDDLVGTLEPGKRADVVAVELSSSHQVPTRDPYGALVHTSNQENVLMTMVDGEVRYEGERWATMDAEEILRRAEPIRMKLRG
ncbi:MAG: amidohydrolase family protein [Coriobacteriia bacterium]|nr:amidohydrolase family protein [Coriobacteriia bacterium]